MGTWAVLIPAFAAKLGLGNGQLGTVLLGFSGGGILAMTMTPTWVRRAGALSSARLAGVLFAAGLLLPVLAPSWQWAIVGGLAFGAAGGSMDVAMNAYAVEFEQRSGSAVLSRMHACFSIGAVGGSLLGGWVLAQLHEVVLAAFSLVLVALAGLTPSLVAPSSSLEGATQTATAAAQKVRRLPPMWLVPLAVVAFCCLVGEGAMIDWTAKLMHEFGASPFVASAVYACFAGGMALGRLAGDSLLERLGERVLLLGGCMLAAVGVLSVLWSGAVILALPALLVAGLGVANVIPVVFRRASVGDGASGLAFVTVCGYGGLLSGPPMIAGVAEWVGLRLALLIVVAGFAVATGASALALGKRRPKLATAIVPNVEQ